MVSQYGPGDPITLNAIEGLVEGGEWLDLAAGDGRYLHNLLERADRVVAVDRDVSRLDDHDRLEILTCDLHEPLPFESERFDGVFCTGTLHLFEPSAARFVLEEIKRILKPDGDFIIDFAHTIERQGASSTYPYDEKTVANILEETLGAARLQQDSFSDSDTDGGTRVSGRFFLATSMHVHIIAIAGGTGSGKSTVTYALVDKYPDVGFIHFDDYQKQREGLNMLEGMYNWDEPNAIDWESLIVDLNALKRGDSVEIMTKNRRDNPRYEENGELRIPIVMEPKPLLILEGYMALVDERIRELLDAGIYLEASHEVRMKRREKIVDDDDLVYFKKVLEPMHERYVKPSKRFADLVIDVSENDIGTTVDMVESFLKNKKLL